MGIWSIEIVLVYSACWLFWNPSARSMKYYLLGIAPIIKEKYSVVVKTNLIHQLWLVSLPGFHKKVASHFAFVEDGKTVPLLSENAHVTDLSSGKIPAALAHAAGVGCHYCSFFQSSPHFVWAKPGWIPDGDSATLLRTGSHGLTDFIVRKLFIKLGNSE